MKKRIKLALYYFIFWYVLFVISRIVFLAVYSHYTKDLQLSEILLTFLYGFKLDASTAAYASFIPTLLLILTSAWDTRWIKYFYHVYTAVITLFFTSIIIGDLVLYKFWNFRMDASPLFYLQNMNAATASVSTWSVIGGILLILLISSAIYVCYFKIFRSLFFDIKSLKSLFILMPFWLLLGITIRGGLGISPLNVSYAYFSDKQFANHAAINPVWNVGSGLFESDDLKKSYNYFSNKELDTYISHLIQTTDHSTQFLNTPKPNIILVIVESLTSKVLAATGANPEIMPHFNQLIKEGVFFDNLYASADRTDRGLAAIIAAQHSLPGSSPLKYPKIIENLPSIAHELNKAGYTSEFIYGGTLEFANYKSFLVHSGYGKFISDKDFPKHLLATKWGAYDETVFNKALEEIKPAKQPFFKTILTLTSHEPYTIPIKPLLEGNSTDVKFINSIHYTDLCIGNFIAGAKTQPWWKNTLVIFIADHGCPYPGNSPATSTPKYHIPMLWLGGALQVRDTIIHQLASQNDLAATLLHQLSLPSSSFTFSHDIFSNKNPFAFFTHSEGLGFMNNTDTVFYNTVSNTFIKPSAKDEINKQAKAYLQYIFEETKSKRK